MVFLMDAALQTSAAAFFAKEERKSGKIAKAHKKRVQFFHGALANAGSIFVKK